MTLSPPTSKNAWRLYVTLGSGKQVHIHAEQPSGGTVRNRPLVCLHGSLYSGVQLAPLQHEMAKDRLVLCLDMPGYGGSDRPDSEPEISDYAAMLLEAVDRSGLIPAETPFDLLGSHTGSVICTELAVTRPAHFNKVVLQGLPLFPNENRTDVLREHSKPAEFLEGTDYIHRNYCHIVLGNPSMDPDRKLELLGEILRAGTLSWWGPRSVFIYDLDAALRRLPLPTLFVVLDDRRAQDTRDAAKLPPHASLVDLQIQPPPPDWNHQPALVWYTQPAIAASHIREFLDT